MEMEDNYNYFGEFFDINSIMPENEIYSLHDGNTTVLHPTTESTTCVIQTTINNRSQTIHELLNSTANLNSSAAQEIIISANPSFPSSTASHYNPSQLFSFGNSENTNYEIIKKDYNSMFPIRTINFGEDDSDINDQYNYHDASNGMIFISSKKKGLVTASRTPVQAQDHVMAERKRREKLGQHFISLSKLVPGLKKLDKASLLEDAIEYLKALKERVSALEEEEEVKCSIDDESKVDININGSSSKLTGLGIKARIMNKSVLLKMFCKNEKGLMSRIPCEIEKMQLSVTDMRMMPFGDAALDITILIEMHSEFRGTVKDIVDRLQMVFLKPRDNLL